LIYSTEEQRARWVPDLTQGEKIGCFALTEPSAGFGTAAIEAQAER
jgi:alkylation response protein AidB-like acyl-CoA dehydrogenase